MADLASLRIAVDSRSVEGASTDLNTMTASAGRSSVAVDKLVASNNRLAAAVATSNKPIIDATRYINSMERELSQVGKSALQIKALEIRMAAAAAPTAELAREIRQVGASLIVAERNAQTTGGAMQQLTAVGGMQRQGFQQLGYQIGDISTMYALGARPMQIFASQVGQITQAVQLAAGGTSRFATFLGGPWGIALTVAVMALGPLIGKLFETADAAETSLSRLDTALARFRSGLAEASTLGEVMTAATEERIGLLAEEGRLRQRLTALQTAMGTPGVSAQGVEAMASQQRSAQARIETIQSEVRGIEGRVRAAVGEAAVQNRIAAEAADRTASQVAANEGVTRSTVAGTVATRDRTQAISDEQRAREQQTESTRDFIAALEEETLRIGMSAAQLRMRETVLQIIAAQTEEERQLIVATSQAREDALAAETAQQRQRESDSSMANSIKELDQLNAALFEERMLRGLTGTERELTAIDLEQEALMASLTTEQMLALGHSYLAYFDAKRAAARQDGGLEDQRKEAERLNAQLEDMGKLLDDVFGTNGKIGGFLNTLKDQFPKLFDSIKQGLDGVLSSLKTSMPELAAGAQMGEMFAGLSKAVGLPSSKMGGQVGGAIGMAIGGPVGAAIGSVVGSMGVGLVKGVKKASATIEIQAANQVTQTVKGNKSLQDAATGMANSLIDGLKQIADALGGELMAGMKISIGQRGSTFRVDPLGLGRTKGMIKFDTEEEAIAYAMKLALEKGVITGIRESTQRLLAAGNDLQAAIEKSVLFESVFDRLLEKTDPLAYSMQKLDEEFEKLKAVFDEAGASLEEYAALQQLYAIEQQQLVVDAAQAALEAQRRINDLMIRLYDASGDSAASLALAREMELAAATEAEKAILRQIYAIEDFTAARDKEVESLQETIDTMQAFSDSLKDFRDSLFKADAGVASYKTALLDLMRVGGLASTGDATALGQLQGVSETFLTASMARASSLFEYQKDVALVAGYVDQGIAAAGEQIDAAQQQIDILDAQLQELISLNSGLDTLNQTLGGGAQTSLVLPVFDANQTGSSVIAGASSDSNAQLASLMAEGLYTIAKNTGATYSLLDRWDGDGQPDIREYVNDYY